MWTGTEPEKGYIHCIVELGLLREASVRALQLYISGTIQFFMEFGQIARA
jgi:hypothetical protein